MVPGALTSLTIVAVIDGAVPAAATLERFAAAAAAMVQDIELVLVVTEVEGDAALRLKALADAVPDLTIVFLAEHVHGDLARLVGIDHAVGDFVLFADVMADDPALLPSLLAPLADGYDVVIGDRGRSRRARSAIDRLLLRAYGALFKVIAGAPLELEPTGLRVFSRAASLHVAGHATAELKLRARWIGRSFPTVVVPMPAYASDPKRGARHPRSKALALLLSASTLPLRGASYAALLGGVLSAVYSVYVFGVFLWKRDVAAGWTTLSLQLAGMMFIFSIVLLFLSEYVIQIYASAPPRSRRSLVVREVRSPLSRRAQRLNVVDGDGQFQLGKPAWLDR
jgi:hypothetical protein